MLTTFIYDKANRLKSASAGGTTTTYQHDAAGNRTALLSPSDSTHYTWNATNRMATAETAAGIVTLTYNADGQRAVKQTTDGSAVGFLYDFKRLLHETDEVGGDISNTYATTTNEEFGDLLEENGESFHQYDAQADTNALLDDAGAVEARYKYTAFGALSAYSLENGPWQQGNLDFTALPPELSTHMLAGGKKQYYLDPETELYLLGTGTNGRYYDPTTARFLNEDPIRQEAGDANLYRYVLNDPVNHLDPSGHEDQKDKDQRKPEADWANAKHGGDGPKFATPVAAKIAAIRQDRQARGGHHPSNGHTGSANHPPSGHGDPGDHKRGKGPSSPTDKRKHPPTSGSTGAAAPKDRRPQDRQGKPPQRTLMNPDALRQARRDILSMDIPAYQKVAALLALNAHGSKNEADKRADDQKKAAARKHAAIDAINKRMTPPPGFFATSSNAPTRNWEQIPVDRHPGDFAVPTGNDSGSDETQPAPTPNAQKNGEAFKGGAIDPVAVLPDEDENAPHESIARKERREKWANDYRASIEKNNRRWSQALREAQERGTSVEEIIKFYNDHQIQVIDDQKFQRLMDLKEGSIWGNTSTEVALGGGGNYTQFGVEWSTDKDGKVTYSLRIRKDDLASPGVGARPYLRHEEAELAAAEVELPAFGSEQVLAGFGQAMGDRVKELSRLKETQDNTKNLEELGGLVPFFQAVDKFDRGDIGGGLVSGGIDAALMFGPGVLKAAGGMAIEASKPAAQRLVLRIALATGREELESQAVKALERAATADIRAMTDVTKGIDTAKLMESGGMEGKANPIVGSPTELGPNSGSKTLTAVEGGSPGIQDAPSKNPTPFEPQQSPLEAPASVKSQSGQSTTQKNANSVVEGNERTGEPGEVNRNSKGETADASSPPSVELHAPPSTQKGLLDTGRVGLFERLKLRLQHRGLIGNLLQGDVALDTLGVPRTKEAVFKLIGDITAATNKEVALLRTKQGLVLRLGETGRIPSISGSSRVIAHSHDSGMLGWSADADLPAIFHKFGLGQRSSINIGPTGAWRRMTSSQIVLGGSI